MAAPVADHYGGASGGVVAGGRSVLPAWAESLTPNVWTELPSTNFLTWANANIPSGAYQGGQPFPAIVDAYADGGYDRTSKKVYFYGGGHADGTCNAVIGCDLSVVNYALTCVPTPPAKYPPSYVNGGSAQPGPLVYPSGAGPFTHFRDDLTDPLDTAYNTPLARASSHMYTASCVRNGVVHFFYGNYAEFDSASGTWANVDGVDFGAQLYAISTNYNNVPLQQGTFALYDSVADRFFVTCIPGDAGGGWRSHLLKINPATRQIETMIPMLDYLNTPLVSSSIVYQDGRKLWVVFNTSGGSGRSMDTGIIYDIDTSALEYFRITGDAATFPSSPSQEAIPGVIYGGHLYRWNYAVAADRDSVHKASLTPVSGAGTQADPYVLSQAKVAAQNSAPTNGLLIYNRLWHLGNGLIVTLPCANSNLWAIKLP